MGASSPLSFEIRTGAPRQVPESVARRGPGPLPGLPTLATPEDPRLLTRPNVTVITGLLTPGRDWG